MASAIVTGSYKSREGPVSGGEDKKWVGQGKSQ